MKLSCTHQICCALSMVLLVSSAQAVNCANNFTPRNPDSVYEISVDGQTVTDTRTGLMWKRCSQGQNWDGNTCSGSGGTFIWDNALASAEASTFAGYEDWRLPNIKELESLTEPCRDTPSINDTVFPGTMNGRYWSASPRFYPDNGNGYPKKDAWYVNFIGGYVQALDRTAGYHVRLVRGE